MSLSKNSAGFSIIEVSVVVAVVGIASFVGYTVYDRQQNKTADNSSQSSQQSEAANNDLPSAPEINSTEDLATAEKTLDDAIADNNKDSTQLDTELGAF